MMRAAGGLLLIALGLTACGDDDGQVNQNQNNVNVTPPVCGNGVPETGEACDDGDQNSDVAPDACRTSCRLPYCGDGVEDSGETCDGAFPPGQDCAALGFGGGILACTDQCQVDPAGCSGWVAVAAGHEHACGLRPDGTVRCWGDNRWGQLGDGTLTSRARPADVVGLTGVVEIAAGKVFSCARQAGGQVLCWGGGVLGQLGDGELTSRPVAGPVSDVEDASSLALGANHACAVRASGEVRCWGYNPIGQTGQDPVEETIGRPTPVPGLGDVVTAAAGNISTCAVRSNGEAYCWGENYAGVLGDGTENDSFTPVRVELPVAVVRIDVFPAFACAATASGETWCWGFGAVQPDLGGGLGLSDAPVRVEHGRSAASHALGQEHACIRDLDGIPFCWGSNEHGALGAGTTVDLGAIVRVASLPPVVSLSSGGYFSCAVSEDLGLRCWGDNARGPLGPGAPSSAFAAVATLGLGGASQIVAGKVHTCAVVGNLQMLFCWGRNASGQLGDGTVIDRTTPAQVPFEQGVISVSLGWDFTCMARDDGSVWCWGVNEYGQLGRGDTDPTLLRETVGGLPPVATVTAGSAHACALSEEGEVYCWGYPTGPAAAPVALADVVALDAGHQSTCAVTAAGRAYCWGENNYGQVGAQAGVDYVAQPALVEPLSEVTDISCGFHHACAVAAGEVWCWGATPIQLSDGTFYQSTLPLQILGEDLQPLQDVVSVSTGMASDCALLQDGSVQCWGRNLWGELGYEELDPAVEHALPFGDFPDVESLSMGHGHLCIVLSSGTIWCSGDNHAGQLGDGRPTLSTVPVIVPDR